MGSNRITNAPTTTAAAVRSMGRKRTAPASTTASSSAKPGIDKAYGIRKLRDLLGISLKEMIFIGDALFVGGNDYPAEEAGVVSIPVRDPHETKRVTEAIIACLDPDQQA